MLAAIKLHAVPHNLPHSDVSGGQEPLFQFKWKPPTGMMQTDEQSN